MAHEELAFPRLLYRGEPDTLGSGTVGETKPVDDRAGYDQALKEGWRATRHDDDHPAEGDAPTGEGEVAGGAKPKAKGKK